MVYVVGIIGFISGFALGQLILQRLLAKYSTEELLSNRMLRLKYGIINWVMAGLGAWSFSTLYDYYMYGSY